ncbi:MAG: glycosyltransferase family 9 protein, partial [Bdellovibrionaceae bacterium]|nr:glycosyltransferase family 9 protein [Pseudobdellovibrionaceae bacterium]
MKKIAIVQINRLGDILQSIPAINAYKRLYPDHIVHLIVRKKFEEAAQLCPTADKIITLDTTHILRPLIQNQPEIHQSLSNLETWLLTLAEERYDIIFNLSYSPSSSWIVNFLEQHSGNTTQVKGYTRTTDGYLAIPDDMSAYVYAQCGINKPNRFHLAEIFGTVLGVDLTIKDWKINLTQTNHPSLEEIPDQFISLHINASSKEKSLPPDVTVELLNNLARTIPIPIVLLGSQKDMESVREVIYRSKHPKIYNMVGLVNLNEAAHIISRSLLLIAP